VINFLRIRSAHQIQPNQIICGLDSVSTVVSESMHFANVTSLQIEGKKHIVYKPKTLLT
jgi:hypothetical protein